MGTYSDLLRSKPSTVPVETLPGKVAKTPSDVAEPNHFEESFAERNSARTLFRSENRTVSLPIKRKTKRYSFEFFEDQLSKLRQLKIQTEMAGNTISLSEIVRTALDNYLHDQDV